MPAATKQAKSPTWGERPRKQAAAAVDKFVKGADQFAPLNVKLRRSLVAQVKAHCAQEGLTIQEWVTATLVAALLPRR